MIIINGRVKVFTVFCAQKKWMFTEWETVMKIPFDAFALFRYSNNNYYYVIISYAHFTFIFGADGFFL